MCGKDRQEIRKYLRLYLILETSMLKLPLKNFLEEVIDGGITAIQIRDKNKSINERYYNAKTLLSAVKGHDILTVINDRLDLALALGVKNVHLGGKDIPLDVARERFPEICYGYSCNNLEDLKIAEESRADYIGVGPAFYTNTKDDLRTVIGPEGILNLVEMTDMPAVAIGGINLNNVEVFSKTKVAGVAVSSAICASGEPKRVVREFLDILNG
ncbi:thiamine phosphate synthase [Deferribacterales bacterium Es71-Z0220]|uniref:thiamine phosphate synthase n=1 Tax=Deferrivibrio essentukiensis TaxID=2880922 RepID=UPI001F60BDAD|nr:thiamine phosphate synthase [Deferrivibrio essentukiensis]MCB4203839.1 thiamine phosphate synthase [Deferrivibrio essentukiensis]